jgi:hypothetical protein
MIKDADLPEKLYSMKEKLSLVKINFLSKFSIQHYFRSFKESFLSIIFYAVPDSPHCYCPKYNGVRIIEKVIFNESNMEFFFANGKFPQFMNKNSDFCTRKASRAYWLDVKHSIFNMYEDVCFSTALDKYWCHVEKSNHGMLFPHESVVRKLNTNLVIDDLHRKSPYIIFLWGYVVTLRNDMILAFDDLQNLENEKNINKLNRILNGEQVPIL